MGSERIGLTQQLDDISQEDTGSVVFDHRHEEAQVNDVISAPGFFRERGEGIVHVEADIGRQPFHGRVQRRGHVESVDSGGGGKPFREIDGPDAAGGLYERRWFFWSFKR